jgi:hypothetical protein
MVTPKPTAAHRAYFIAVGVFALWVGCWGFVLPSQIGRALPWTVPPMHARFIASMYLAGALAMGWSLLARGIGAVRIPIALAALWTGALLLVSVVRLSDFDFAKPQVWFWMGAYIVFPIWGLWLYLSDASIEMPATRTPHALHETTSKIDPLMITLSVLFLALSFALLVLPDLMVRVWPWPIQPLLACIYAGPFFAYGVSAAMLARAPGSSARLITVASMLAFAVLTLIASMMHTALFHFDGPAAWVWFGGFGACAALLAARFVKDRNS